MRSKSESIYWIFCCYQRYKIQITHRKTKISLYKTKNEPILLYGNDNLSQKLLINKCERKILRIIFLTFHKCGGLKQRIKGTF